VKANTKGTVYRKMQVIIQINLKYSFLTKSIHISFTIIVDTGYRIKIKYICVLPTIWSKATCVGLLSIKMIDNDGENLSQHTHRNTTQMSVPRKI
jgi:hypothetical protein